MQKFLLVSTFVCVAVARHIDPAEGTFSLSADVSQSSRTLAPLDPLWISALVPPAGLRGEVPKEAPDDATRTPDLNDLAARQAATPASSIVTTSLPTTAPSSTGSSWSPYLGAAHFRGINVVNESPNRYPEFKNATEWDTTFALIRTLPGDFNAVRLYSTTEAAANPSAGTEHLTLALDAAKTHNISIHVGVWSGGDAGVIRFNSEKAALEAALKAHGCTNILAVSVGNEDLYFASTDVSEADRIPMSSSNLLIDQINQVSRLLDDNNCCHIPVTHTDTWHVWLAVENAPLMQAVDFVSINIFPYWEKAPIEDALNSFQTNLANVVMHADSFEKDVWISEFGWPFNGSSIEAAIPSTANEQTFYKTVICPVLQKMNAFIYVLWDWPDTSLTNKPAFGVWNSVAGQARIDLSCN